MDLSLNSFNQMLLDSHNTRRNTHHALPLAYSAALAADAQAYANTLAANIAAAPPPGFSAFQHDPNIPADQGENLYTSTNFNEA